MTSIIPFKDTLLFSPLKVGEKTLSSRAVFAPTTRLRASNDHVPTDLMLQHYTDRASYPGSLIIAEATLASDFGGGFANVPGIWSSSQTAAWKKIADGVHAKGVFFAMQIYSAGRAADAGFQASKGRDLVGPSAIHYSEEHAQTDPNHTLRALTEKEIHDIIHFHYPRAVKNALSAGVDIVELHASHGYLLDQFLHPSSNKRTDKYGGLIENRARLLLDIIDHLVLEEGIPASKLAIRISPWAIYQGMLAEKEQVSPVETFTYVVTELQKRADSGHELAYLSLVEPRVSGAVDVAEENGNNDFILSHYKGVLVKSGNYTYDAPEFKTLLSDISDGRTLIGFSRHYTSNPDLLHRLEKGLSLTKYIRDHFYTFTNWGYNTFSKYEETRVFDEHVERQIVPRALA